jgi:hypothetical protein
MVEPSQHLSSCHWRLICTCSKFGANLDQLIEDAVRVVPHYPLVATPQQEICFHGTIVEKWLYACELHADAVSASRPVMSRP